MKIILTGASGLIGSRFEELMFETHEIIPLSITEGVDITDKATIERFLEGKDAEAILHLAAKTDVDGCETDKPEDLRLMNIDEGDAKSFNTLNLDTNNLAGNTTAFAINAAGTKNLKDVAVSCGWKFI